jgi:hypothetical protein
MRTARVQLVWVGPFPADDVFARVGDITFQICRATVNIDERTLRVAMFWPRNAQPTSLPLESLADTVQKEPATTVPSIVRASAEGRIAVDTTRGDEPNLFAVAAVAAVARVSWAWDDGPTISVTVNGQRITIDPTSMGEAWEAVEIADQAV